jgi:hypothetical protein
MRVGRLATTDGVAIHLVPICPVFDGTVCNGMIMFGSVKVSEFDRLTKQPDEIGDAETQTAYIIVSGR